MSSHMQAHGRCEKEENLFNDSYKAAKTPCFCQDNTKARESFTLTLPQGIALALPHPKHPLIPPQGCAIAAGNMLNHSLRFTEAFVPGNSSISIPGKMAHYFLTAFCLTLKALSHWNKRNLWFNCSCTRVPAKPWLYTSCSTTKSCTHTHIHHKRNIIIKAKLPNLMWRQEGKKKRTKHKRQKQTKQKTKTKPHQIWRIAHSLDI